MEGRRESGLRVHFALPFSLASATQELPMSRRSRLVAVVPDPVARLRFAGWSAASRRLALALVLAAGVAAGHAQEPPPGQDPQVLALEKLRRDSQRAVSVSFAAGIPRHVAAKVAVPSQSFPEPVSRALAFLDAYRDLYRLESPRAELYLRRLVSDGGGHHVFFGQHREGIPVFGAELAVHLDADHVTGTNGSWLVPPLPAAETRIAAADAERIALAAAGEGAAATGVPRLLYVDTSSLGGQQTGSAPRLVWRVPVTASAGATAPGQYLVDAADGAVVLHLPATFEQAPAPRFDIRSAGGTAFVRCADLGRTVQWLTAAGPTVEYPGGDRDGDNALPFLQGSYDYFAGAPFRRRGWDGVGGPISVVLHGRSTGYRTDCNLMVFDDDFVTRDVLAHEYTHGIVARTAVLDGSANARSLNESYADVFAAMIDGDDWLIGEDLPAGVIPDGALRDLSDPPRVPMLLVDGRRLPPPDHMRDFSTAVNPVREAHFNSTIPTKAAYLLSRGGTHGGLTVAALGRDRVAALYYDVLTRRLTASASFEEAAGQTAEQAWRYADEGRPGWSWADVCTVTNAFSAVGLGRADQDCDGTPDDGDADDDGDAILDSRDLCPRAADPRQEDTDGDRLGDACDDDDDADGIRDDGDASGLVGDRRCVGGATAGCDDNCRLVRNPAQADRERNGIGDACEDPDRDGVSNDGDGSGIVGDARCTGGSRSGCDDNCISVANRDQGDVDGDRIGDACDADADGDGVPLFDPLTGAADNCPLQWNPGQEDADADGVGDACDNCASLANSDQANHDRDPPGDACDADDDDDGILDDGDGSGSPGDGTCVGGATTACDDNCPFTPNATQVDLDENGVGIACDPDEQAIPLLAEAASLRLLLLDSGPVRIPILPCLAGLTCPPILDRYRTQVRIEGLANVSGRIVDDEGTVVAQPAPAGEGWTFHPSADYHFLAPGLQGAKPYQGRRYFLELWPTDGKPAGAQLMKLGVESTIVP
jgi:Zn-dependent metalloprotease